MEKRILLVDDEPMVLTAISRALRRQGIEVLTAESGEQALEVLQSDVPPLILSDYLMPGMTGTELLAKIEVRWPHTIRMIISAHSDFQTVLNAIQSGVVHKFLAKPWSDDELLFQVLSALAQASVNFERNRSEPGVENEPVHSTQNILSTHQVDSLSSNLKAKEAQLQAILDTVQDGMVTISRRGVILSANPSLERIFGYSTSELLGNNISKLMPEPYRDEHDGFLASYQTPEQKDIVGSLRRLVGLRKNGEVFPIELCVNEMQVEGEPQFLGVIRDISESVLAERENQLLLEALNSCQDGFALFGPGGRLIRCNEQFRSLYRKCQTGPVEGITYQAFFQDCVSSGLFPAAERDPKQWLEQRVKDHARLPLERELEIEPGRWIQIHETKTEHEGVIAFHLDVTRQKQTELTLKDAVLQAEQASNAKSSFLAMMSHEIRTPLNGVLGLLQLLQESSLSALQRSYIETALASGQSLLTILSDILDFSKIEAEKMDIYPAACSLSRIVQDIPQLFEARLDEKLIRLKVELDPALPEVVSVDAQRLRQILLNLVGNAVKFTDNGEVKLIISKASYGHVYFEVSDTGVGIAKSDLHKLFTEFSTVNRSHHQTHEGTGLGLTISQRLVHLMGGKLYCESEEGCGSRFWFNLELPSVDEVELLVPETVVSGVSLSGHVLLVDDGETNRMVANAILVSHGLTVTCAEDGETSLALCQSHLFDLILMDISLPGISGVEATQEIRLIPGYEAVPVIALTAYAMPGDRERFIEQNMDDYIGKPLDKQNLIAVISKFLESSSESEPSAEPSRDNETPVSNGALVNLEKLHRLAQDTSYGMLPELVRIFTIDAGKRLQELNDLGKVPDVGKREIIKRHLHTLGSSSALYGLDLFQQQARHLELQCDDEFAQVCRAIPVFLSMAEQSLIQLVDSVTVMHESAQKQ